MKNFLTKFAVYAMLVLTVLTASYALDLNVVQAAVPDVNEFVRDLGEDGDFYNPADEGLHRRALDESIAPEGVSVIQTVILQVIDVAKYLLGSAAVLMMTILGIRLVVTSKAEETITEAKKHFMYVLIGFVLVMIADFMISNVFFGAGGEVLTSEESARFFARQGSLEIQNIYSAVEFFVGAIAVLMVIYHGFRMVTSAGEDIDTHRKGIMWGIAGLVMIGLSELVIKNVLFVEQGSTIDIDAGIDVLVTMTNFITGFVAFISVALVVYAGIQFVIAFVSEGSNEKGKKALLAAVIGMLIVAGSYALTATMISFTG